MTPIQRSALALGVAAMMVMAVGAAPVAAGQDAPPSPSQQQQVMAIKGELVSVDTDAKTIAVRADDDKTLTFEYTDDTKVTGAKDSPAGLAGAKDAEVTIAFTEKGDAKVALQIVVHPAE